MSERDESDQAQETRERAVHGTVEDAYSTRGPSDGFLPSERMEFYRTEWGDLQAAFVDDPQTAVQEAHGLVSTLMGELNDTLSNERGKLESQWNRGEKADTEALRVALTRYRAFFNRLLR